VLRKTLRRISLFLLVFALIWATAAALDTVAEPQALRPEATAAAATLPSRGGVFGGDSGDGQSREMIACAGAVLTLVVLVSIVNRGRDRQEAGRAEPHR
jgi:putative exporter of polyketide antibiotics